MLEFDKLIHTLKAIEIAYIKKSMTIDDLVNYTGFKVSYIYKLTSGNLIPHSKPGGGKVFFDKDEIDIWLLSNREDSKMPKD